MNDTIAIWSCTIRHQLWIRVNVDFRFASPELNVQYQVNVPGESESNLL